MQHPDEGMIHTWLDAELSQEEATALEAHVAECPRCKAAVAEARGFIAASSRIVGTLDNVPGNVIPIASPAKRTWYSSPQFRAAAAVLIVAGASFLVMKPVTQKSTLAVSGKVEANEAATSQRATSVPDSSAAKISAPVQPPVVADQAMQNAQTPGPLSAPAAPPVIRRRESIPNALSAPKIPNEADFSGKGVKGGAAMGVARAVDTAAVMGKVAGVAASAADAMKPAQRAFAAIEPELKVVHVDSSAMIKRTIYQSLSGKQVVLTEEPANAMLAEIRVTGESAQSRKAAAQPRPTAANAPVAPTPTAPAVQGELVVHSITWMDPATRRRYTLTGPVAVEELEAIKARLLKTKE
jgi:hypothetical protein